MTKPKPLRNKKLQRIPGYGVEKLDIGMCFMSSDVKSAVEFYKRYKVDISKENIMSGVDLLCEDYPELYRKFQDSNTYKIFNNENPLFYNDWLFDYCFGDVIE